MDDWTSSTFPKEIEFYQKSNWVLVPILGVVYLFTSNDIWKYDAEIVMWTKIDSSIEFNLNGLAFLRLAFEWKYCTYLYPLFWSSSKLLLFLPLLKPLWLHQYMVKNAPFQFYINSLLTIFNWNTLYVCSERLHWINKDFSIWCHDLLKFFGVATLHLSWKSNVQLGKTIIFWDTTNVPVYIRWPKNFTKNRSNLHGNVAVAFRVQFK